MSRATLIDYRRKLILTINYKCASTKLIVWFRSNIRNYEHKDLKLSNAINRKYVIRTERVRNNRNYYRVMVVRNPYFRIVSCFLNRGFENYRPLKELCQKRGCNLKDLTFRKFVRFLKGEDPKQMDGHWKPLTLDVQPQHYNKIIKLENIDAELSEVAKQFKMTPFPKKEELQNFKTVQLADKTLEQLQKMPDEVVRHYKNYYTLGIQYKVKKMYKSDFLKFGYSVKLL